MLRPLTSSSERASDGSLSEAPSSLRTACCDAARKAFAVVEQSALEAIEAAAAMRSLEAAGRLRRAKDRVVESQRIFPLSRLWGEGDKASADMMSLGASQHLWNARVDPRSRTYAAGLYTHVLDRYGIVYDQPIVLNERQAGAAIAGVEHYNREQQERVSMVAVDTHGYTHAGMAGAKLLGFDLCPRLRALAERKLYVPSGWRAGRDFAGNRTGGQHQRRAQCGPQRLGRHAALCGLDPHGTDQCEYRVATVGKRSQG